jgi:hypothetical protein
MTHDELLIEINRRLEVALYNGDPQSIHALRAVVELHKPDSNGDCCNVCLSWPIDHEDYPCPTIQAIEKELA